jgi:hypothetical protein
MKILLQHRKTGLYFNAPGVWTRDPQSATDFRTSREALQFVQEQCMADIQITAAFINPPYVELISFPQNSIRQRL